jgi:hypothetical protein
VGFEPTIAVLERAKTVRALDCSATAIGNLNNVSHEASRRFRSRKREYLKDKINELAMNSTNNNMRSMYRGINAFKRGCQPRSNLVKVEIGDILAESRNIF